MKSLQAEFFQQMNKGAQDFAHKQNTFELKTVGTSTQTEIDLQIQLIQSLIDEKVDALVVVPIDSKALVPVVVKAVQAGIKVINIDIKLDEELLQKNGVELTYVGPDNETASYTVGMVLAKKLKKGSNVILIEGLPVAENAQQRAKGFRRSIAEYHLNLVGSGAADWETDKAEKVFSKLYTDHPSVDGVMCCNDAMALGVITVLEKHAKAGVISVVGFDNDASVQPLLKSGVLLATIDAYGSEMAVQGIEYALKVLEGMANKGSFSTEYRLIQCGSLP
ncbi:MAG: sugar ABC transporter substrate-binding protein [Ignavibacteriae bacterium]|nr:MAG: sugar ABC transporter substrate-binding protein [Ignavibacteriota bacterium]